MYDLASEGCPWEAPRPLEEAALGVMGPFETIMEAIFGGLVQIKKTSGDIVDHCEAILGALADRDRPRPHPRGGDMREGPVPEARELGVEKEVPFDHLCPQGW